MDYISRQDMFDSQASLSPVQVGILMGFSNIWEKHSATIDKQGMTEEVFKDYRKLARKFDVEYTPPSDVVKQLKLVH